MPVEILRFLQKHIVEGKELDVGDTSDTAEGETNYICVNRHDILTSTFPEQEAIQNFHITSNLTLSVRWQGIWWDKERSGSV